MNKYPTSLVSDADLPERADGTVIYGQHMNAVQDEIIAIEEVLGLGVSDVAESVLEGGFVTLAARLRNYGTRLTQADQHRGSTSNVHGVTGAVVGTTDTQTLSKKTLVDPKLQGTVDVSGTGFSGNVSFTGAVDLRGGVSLGAFTANDFTGAQHDHTTARGGGRIPPVAIYDAVSGKNLTQLLAERAPVVHNHTRSQISDFAHTLAEHSGDLPASRVTGLGTGANLSVPATPGGTATNNQLVRGDDPRLSDLRWPKGHAAMHATDGSDPVTPASIGAAPVTHNHTRAQITDFRHELGDHSGALDMNRVYGLVTALNGKLPTNGTAADSARVGGRKVTVGGAAPGSPSTGDVWITY